LSTVVENGLRLPDFIAVGPPRTGSTWLHEVLAAHADLPRYNKETRFFDSHFDRGLKWYAAHFDRSSSLRRGEVCPTYFSSAPARDRIAKLIPAARIICTFRDPAARAFSLYRIKRAYAAVNLTFEEALERDPELMESGRYAYHLTEWQRIFGRSQVLATIYEDLAQRPQAFLDSIADFVGIARFELDNHQSERVNSSDTATDPPNFHVTRLASAIAEWLKAHHWGKTVARAKRSPLGRVVLGGAASIPSPDPATQKRLRELFLPEVEALEELLNRDLAAWKPR
jgi:hypothetical protein